MRALGVCFVLCLLTIGLSSVGLAAGFSESPMLAERVAAGELPSVEERLPAEPFIVGPGVLIAEEDLDWEPGRYGGTLRSAHDIPHLNTDLFIMANEALLIAPGIGTEGIRGNIVRDFSVSEDNRVFTFYMREGLKWSDGHPVTTEDIRFTYEDFLLNESLTPVFPRKFRSGGSADGEVMQLDVIDDYTFTFSFAEPYGAFLKEISITGWAGYTELLKPKHYLQQFHINYTTLEEMAPYLAQEELDEDEWWQLFQVKDVTNWDLNRDKAIGFPVLYPWVRVEAPGGWFVFERNPYYHKVDVEGQQLPYIDHIRSQEVSDVETIKMKIITGEMDYARSWPRVPDIPFFLEHAERAGYEVYNLGFHVDPVYLLFNLTHEDQVWRDVVGDVRFRKAVSLGIDREEIIESLFLGLGELPRMVPADWDVARANQLLDEMGLDQRSADGYRLGPDGEVFEILLEHGGHRADITQACELLQVQLEENLGLRVDLKQISHTLWGQRAAANELMATAWFLHSPLWSEGTFSDYLPSDRWAPLWETWYLTGGMSGEEPPEDIKDIYRVFEGRILATPYSEEDMELVDRLFELYYENVYAISLAENVVYPMIASKKLGNIPTSGLSIAANYSGEQFFFKE